MLLDFWSYVCFRRFRQYNQPPKTGCKGTNSFEIAQVSVTEMQKKRRFLCKKNKRQNKIRDTDGRIESVGISYYE